MTVPQAAFDAVKFYTTKPNPIARGPAIDLVSVFYIESGLNPTAENNSGSETGGVINQKGSYGLEQLNGPRQQRLVDYVAKHGGSVSDFDTQLAFALTEAADYYPEVFVAIQDGGPVGSTVPIIVTKFEIPANPTPEINAAIAAGKLFDAAIPVYTTPPVPIPAPPAPTPTPPAPTPPAPPQPEPPVLTSPTTIKQIKLLLQVLTSLADSL